MAVNTTLVQFTEDITSVVSSIVTMFGSILEIFMQPPLSFIVGIGIFGTILSAGWRMIKSRRR